MTGKEVLRLAFDDSACHGDRALASKLASDRRSLRGSVCLRRSVAHALISRTAAFAVLQRDG